MKPFIYDMAYLMSRSALNRFKVVSTFAGCGGSSSGYRLAGGKVMAINEFIPEAQRVYRINYPDTYIFPQDIRKLTGQMILDQIGMQPGELDIFDGSPPCSSFSTAGLREKGWGKVKKYSDSEQRTDDLFFEYTRILRELQPKVFVAENVKGITLGSAMELLGNGQMDIWETEEKTIYKHLVDCGYRVKYKVLNAAHYGVPQARERTIFIGVRNDLGLDPIFPKQFDGMVSSREAIADIVLSESDKKGLWKTDGTKFKELWELTTPGNSFSIACKEKYGKGSWFSQTKLDPTRPSCTVTTQTDVISHWEECRLFHIKEVKRFCSFPDDYYLGDDYTKQFERAGRAVPPLMMKAIAESVYFNILAKLEKVNPLHLKFEDFV